jgi:hypothetical protein
VRVFAFDLICARCGGPLRPVAGGSSGRPPRACSAISTWRPHSLRSPRRARRAVTTTPPSRPEQGPTLCAPGPRAPRAPIDLSTSLSRQSARALPHPSRRHRASLGHRHPGERARPSAHSSLNLSQYYRYSFAHGSPFVDDCKKESRPFRQPPCSATQAAASAVLPLVSRRRAVDSTLHPRRYLPV